MNKNNAKDRNTLKEYFKKGKTPTEEQFAEWIDSTPNLLEDGQVVRTAAGWTFYPQKDGKMDIRLYKAEPTTETEPATWALSVTPDKKSLLIKNEQSETILAIEQDKSITLHGKLTVNGEVTASQFLKEGGGGGRDYQTIPADKEWHDILVDTTKEGFGCRAYRIYASCREQSTGLCQLTRVTAIWLNRLEQRIESPQKHWWGWAGSVRFRWKSNGKTPCLQMRSKKQLPSGEIHFRIIELYEG